MGSAQRTGSAIARVAVVLLWVALAGASASAAEAPDPAAPATSARAADDTAVRRAIGAPFALRSATGTPLTEHSFRGRWLLVFFGYTSCPDVCPTTLATLTRAFELLGEDRRRIRGLFVSLDPRRDTPGVLSAYIAHFSPLITATTGTQAQIDDTVRVFRVRYEIEGDVASGRYLISHPAGMLLFDPEGAFVSLVPGGAGAEDIVRTLRSLFARRAP